MKTPSTPRLFLLVLAICLGCARQNSQDLKLQNVIEYEAAQKASRASRENEKKNNAASPEIPSVPQSQILHNPEFPELDFLELPSYHLLSSQEKADLKLLDAQKTAPALGVWTLPSSTLTILVFASPLEKGSIQMVSRENFLAHLKNEGENYKKVFLSNHRGTADYSFIAAGGIIVLLTKAEYKTGSQELVDQCYIIYYSLDHYLKLLVTGTKQDFEKNEPSLKLNLELFLKKLALTSNSLNFLEASTNTPD